MSSRSERVGWSLGRPAPRDVVLAAAVCVLDLVLFSSVLLPRGIGVIALAVVCYLPLVWRRRAPIPVFFIMLFFTLAVALAVPDLQPNLGLLLATYTVAADCARRIAYGAGGLAAAALVVSTVADAYRDGSPTPVTVVLAAALLTMLVIGAVLLGRWVQASRNRVRAAELAALEAAEAARVEERRQIALELHDIISHAVSVMVVQADGGKAVLRNDPDSAEEALDQIAKVGRSSVGELRRLLGVLSDGSSVEEAGSGGLDDLADVIAQAEQAGLRITFEVTGHPPVVPASFERSVYRIVRESLANSLKHGGPGTGVTVTLFWADTVLVVTIADDGAGRGGDATLSTGHGLAGLQERVRATEGRLDAKPAAGGRGFVVTATLPIPPPAAQPAPAGPARRWSPGGPDR